MASRDAYQKLCGLVAGSRSSCGKVGRKAHANLAQKIKKAASSKLQAPSRRRRLRHIVARHIAP